MKHRKKIVYICVYFLYVFIVMWPIMKMGIACNDDLKWRLYSSDGFVTLATKYIAAAKLQGRMLSCVQIVSLWLSCYPSRIMYGILKVLFFGIQISLLGLFLKKNISSKVGNLFLLLMPVLLQITLQHTPPDAFSMFVVLPSCYFLVALLLFDKYLANRKKWILALSILLYFMALCSYELFILYSPLFLFVLYNNANTAMESFVKKLWNLKWHVCSGMLFLVLYIGQRFVFPSNYEGNKINVSSVSETLSLQKMLIKSGIPGIYRFSGKGNYLFQYIMGFPNNTLRTIITKVIDARVVMVLLCVGVANIFIIRVEEKWKASRYIWAGVVATIYIVLPPILNALCPSWIGLGDLTDIIALPVSYLISVAWVVLVCIVVSLVTKRLHSKIGMVVIAFFEVGVLIWTGNVQIYNNVYSELQVKSSDRIEYIENVLQTETMKAMGTIDIYSPDMCTPYVMQCATASDWNEYISYNHLSASVYDQMPKQYCYVRLEKDGKCIWFGKDSYLNGEKIYSKHIYLFSPNMLNGKCVRYELESGAYGELVCPDVRKDNKCWVTELIFDEAVCISSISVE